MPEQTLLVIATVLLLDAESNAVLKTRNTALRHPQRTNSGQNIVRIKLIRACCPRSRERLRVCLNPQVARTSGKSLKFAIDLSACPTRVRCIDGRHVRAQSPLHRFAQMSSRARRQIAPLTRSLFDMSDDKLPPKS